MSSTSGLHHETTRREFMRTAAVLGAGAMALGMRPGYAEDAAPMRVGLVGCGRRGIGAAIDCIKSSPNVVITAIGDLFEDQLKSGRERLLKQMEAHCQFGDSACFTGFDAYQKVIASEVDLVLLCAPPGFRPLHLKAAVEAGKHVFMEKPVAVDPVGIRSILDSAELADKKKLSIVAGTQRRHQAPYLDLIRRIHEGAIGEIVSGHVYWVGDYGYYPAVLRQPGWSDMEAQIRNWNYFTWLSGDHIVEQHVHNIDIANWVMQSHPERAFGLGGRQQRTGAEFGHIYDHFAVEYEYPNGVRIQSLCRQNEDTFERVGEHFVGTLGTAEPGKQITGQNKHKYKGEDWNPYEREHADLIASIRAGKPINEAKTIAESTLTAIMGRMAAYTGQEVTWDFVMKKSKLDLAPAAYVMGDLPVPPVAVPGKDKLA